MSLIARKMSSHNNIFMCSQHVFPAGKNPENHLEERIQRMQHPPFSMWAAVAEAAEEHDAAYSRHPEASYHSTRESWW